MAFEYRANLLVQLINIMGKYDYFLVHADGNDRKELLALKLKTQKLIDSIKASK